MASTPTSAAGTEPAPARGRVGPRAGASGLTAGERRLRLVLRVLGVLLLVPGALVCFVGPFAHEAFFHEVPYVAVSVAKVTVLGLGCLYAAGAPRRRREVAWIVVGAHLASVATCLVVLAFGDPLGTVDLGPWDASRTTVLWLAVALDGVIAAVLIVALLCARAPAGEAGAREAVPPAEDPLVPAGPLGPAELRVRALANALAALSVLFAAAFLAGLLLDGTRDAFVEQPLATNGVVLASAVALLCRAVGRDVRGNLPLTGPVIAACGVLAAVAALYLLTTLFGWIDGARALALWDFEPTVAGALWATLAIAALAGAGLALAARAAWRERESLAFFSGLERRSAMALADTLIAGRTEVVPPPRIASNVEAYVQAIRSNRRLVFRGALLALELAPLTRAWPPLSEIEPAARRDYLERRFVRRRRWPRHARPFIQILIRIGQQLTFAGYYDDPGSWASIGYVPFSRRDRELARPTPPREPLELEVDTPKTLRATKLAADVCIVGSGAAGATLAYGLAQRGLDVLVLERGLYVEPRDFSEREVEMIGQLYGDGILQQTQDFRFAILQGGCVGGSTTVNNAVCFRAPEAILDRWDVEAGLPRADVEAGYDWAERFLSVGPQDDAVLNRSAGRYLDGAVRAGLAPDRLTTAVVDANIRDCVGCGYCNIGCRYGRKLSMLDVMLPAAQAVPGGGSVRIVAECGVERIKARDGSPARVTELRARLGDRTLHVQAGAVVLSAGAVASSRLLQRSRIGAWGGAGPRLPVGRRLCFNMGAPLTAEFAEPQRAYDGLQISHYGIPRDEHGYVFETWFNPPVAQALNMPGWFEQHFDNMLAYERLMAVGVLVGTKGNAQVRGGLLSDVRYTPDREDLETLGRGLRRLGELLFAGGARRLLVNAWEQVELLPGDDLDRLRELARDPGFITLGTGHPQGGNPLGTVPADSVVGPDFRVHGFANLYVCDASVFPSSLTVNPQLTVMALARHAAGLVEPG